MNSSNNANARCTFGTLLVSLLQRNFSFSCNLSFKLTSALTCFVFRCLFQFFTSRQLCCFKHFPDYISQINQFQILNFLLNEKQVVKIRIGVLVSNFEKFYLKTIFKGCCLLILHSTGLIVQVTEIICIDEDMISIGNPMRY